MHSIVGIVYLLLPLCNCNTETYNITNSGGSEKSIVQSEQYSLLERSAIDKLRPLVEDILVKEDDKSDGFLIRWLRARNMDVVKAADMLRADNKWRRENNVDSIQNETIFDIQPPPFSADGFDREGHPVIILTPTILDVRKVALQGQTDKIYRYVIQVIEKGMASRSKASKIFGKEIHQIIPIFDLHGFNIRQHACITCIPVFLDLFRVFENHYPECMKYLIAINVPRIALPLYELLKPVMSPSTLKVLHIFPPDRKEWSSFLLKIIAPDQLPYRFGGTKPN